jgi:hypothetical protein
MKRLLGRGFICFASSLVFFLIPTVADADYFSATISVAALPSTITLCRDPQAYARDGNDEKWFVGVDVDNNAATGFAGSDVLFVVHPNQLLDRPCTPTTVSTDGNVLVEFNYWDNLLKQFLRVDAHVSLILDFVNSSMTVEVPVTGPLVGLSSNSVINVSAYANYTSDTGTSSATDAIPVFSFGSLVTSPQGDVAGCSLTGCQGQSWYPLVDLVGASTARLDILFKDSFEFF